MNEPTDGNPEEIAVTIQRLSEMYSEVIEKNIKANSGGEEVWWETGLINLGNGFAFGLLILIKSPLVGQYLQANVVFGKGPGTTEDDIEHLIPETMENLRIERSKMLAGGNGEGLTGGGAGGALPPLPPRG